MQVLQQNHLKFVLLLSVTALSFFQLYNIHKSGQLYLPPSDFITYYCAGKAFNSGLNPYNVDVLANTCRAHGNHSITGPFLYHPYVLFSLSPFARLDLTTSIAVYRILCGILFTVLSFLWYRLFQPDSRNSYFILSLLLCAGFPYIEALVIGNPAILEAFFIWYGLSLVLSKKSPTGWIFFTFALLIKTTPIILMCLLSIESDNERKKILTPNTPYLFGAVLVYFSAFLALPSYSMSFARLLLSATEHRYMNSSLNRILSFYTEKSFADILYGLVFIAVCIFYIFNLSKKTTAESFKTKSTLLVATYFLISPRVAAYSYVQYLPIVAWLNSKIPVLLVLNGLIWIVIRYSAVLDDIYWAVFAYILLALNWWLLARPLAFPDTGNLDKQK